MNIIRELLTVGACSLMLLFSPMLAEGQVVVLQPGGNSADRTGNRLMDRYLETKFEALGFTVLDTDQVRFVV